MKAVGELVLGRAVDELDGLVGDELLQEAQSDLIVFGGTSVPELLALRDAGSVVLEDRDRFIPAGAHLLEH